MPPGPAFLGAWISKLPVRHRVGFGYWPSASNRPGEAAVVRNLPEKRSARRHPANTQQARRQGVRRDDPGGEA
jgi:hypothetical protein